MKQINESSLLVDSLNKQHGISFSNASEQAINTIAHNQTIVLCLESLLKVSQRKPAIPGIGIRKNRRD